VADPVLPIKPGVFRIAALTMLIQAVPLKPFLRKQTTAFVLFRAGEMVDLLVERILGFGIPLPPVRFQTWREFLPAVLRRHLRCACFLQIGLLLPANSTMGNYGQLQDYGQVWA